MSKASLTAEQLKAAKDLDKTLESLTTIADKLKNYKIGEIYILEQWDPYNPKDIEVNKTSMGFPKKYMVCYVSPEGIPYLRQITGKGNPTGDTIIPPEAQAVNILKRFHMATTAPENWRFTPDPDQMDSILLQTDFDPMELHREKSKLYNQINKHNKNVSVPTGWSDFGHIASFFKSRQPGDKFWTAPDKQYVIQSVAKVGREYVITCTDWNNATVTFNFSHFHCRRLYKEQPRSFSKESAK